MYRTANPGMTVRPRPWPRGVASSTELSLIKWHKERGGFPLLEIHRQHSGTSKPKKCNMISFTLRFNRMNSVRKGRIRPMVDRRSCACHLNSNLSYHPSLSSLLINVRPTNLRADTTELVEEKETPATKHSRLQKRRPNNRQVVKDTSDEEADAL